MQSYNIRMRYAMKNGNEKRQIPVWGGQPLHFMLEVSTME